MTDEATTETTSTEAPAETSSTETTTTPEVTTEAPVAPAPLSREALTLPKGVDDASVDSFLTIVNDSEMDPVARANKLIELQSSLAEAARERGSAQLEEIQQGWAKDFESDPEIGGANKEKTIASIARLVDRFGDQKTRDAFDLGGLGNHPEVIRFLARIGKEFAEPATPPPPNGQQTQPRSLADRLFGQ